MGGVIILWRSWRICTLILKFSWRTFWLNLYYFAFQETIYACVCVSLCVYVCVLFAQSRLTLWNPMDCSLPGSSVRGILQASISEWIALPFSKDLSRGLEARITHTHTHTHTHTYTHRQALSLPCKILQSSEGQIRKKGNHHPLWWNNIDSRYRYEGRVDKIIGFN